MEAMLDEEVVARLKLFHIVNMVTVFCLINSLTRYQHAQMVVGCKYTRSACCILTL
jgi:hypothetical protein